MDKWNNIINIIMKKQIIIKMKGKKILKKFIILGAIEIQFKIQMFKLKLLINKYSKQVIIKFI